VDCLAKHKIRILKDYNNSVITFTVRLKINEESFKENNTFSDTACVQYTSKKGMVVLVNYGMMKLLMKYYVFVKNKE